jgi:DNA-binding transcriptional ArsR family regulator
MERDFKGIWIDKGVWLDKRLNALDKVILVEIDSLDVEGQGCWASNDYLAEFCQCKARTVSRTITKLKELGYIEQTSFDGRHRILRSRLDKKSRLPRQNVYADRTKCLPININNNKKNNNIYNNLPDWFNKDIEIVKPTEEEQKEIDSLLKQFM